MLPKVATHILHHTSRAVTAVQNQTGYTIRNVLQLQTQSSTSPATTGSGLGGYGSSSWGSAGAGPGGSKYHAGSRFYTGYSVSPAFTLIRYPTWFSNWKKWAFRTQVFQCFFFVKFTHSPRVKLPFGYLRSYLRAPVGLLPKPAQVLLTTLKPPNQMTPRNSPSNEGPCPRRGGHGHGVIVCPWRDLGDRNEEKSWAS